jgi:hypothetical protein
MGSGFSSAMLRDNVRYSGVIDVLCLVLDGELDLLFRGS